jgi:acyl-CoA synthetase (AMP-forming)/AMP-acid ligase II
MNAMDPVPLYAARTPRKAAIVMAGQTVTYAELDRRTDRLAAGLLGLGLRAGDVVAVMIPTGIESVVANVAVMKAGLVFTGLNIMFRPFEVNQIVADCGVRAIIVHEDLVAAVEAGLEGVETVEHLVVVGSGRGAEPTYGDFLERPVDGPQTRSLNPAQLAALNYTGGTTGLPKGAMHDHANIAIQMEKHRLVSRFGPEDRILGVVPTFLGTSFIAAAWCALANGATTYLQERMDADLAADWVEQEKITYLWASIANIQRFNDLPEDRDFSSISRITAGGFAHPPALRLEFEERFGAPIYLSFGMSENVNTIMQQPLDTPEEVRRPKYEYTYPFPNVIAAVLDDDGEPLPPGEPGELCLRDDGGGTWKPMLGYLGRPAETAAALAGGWLHTNDLAEMDEDGWVKVHGRRGDLIKVSGYQLFAAEIENVVNDDPRVHQVAVAGVPDEHTIQKPVAWVVLREGAEMSREEVIDAVAARLARFKHLKDAVFVEELPLSPYGKAQKHILVAGYQAAGEPPS